MEVRQRCGGVAEVDLVDVSARSELPDGRDDVLTPAVRPRQLTEAESAVDAERYLFSLPQFVVTGRRP